MNLDYFDTSKVSHLIEEYFHLSFQEEDIPFKSKVLPIGLTHLFYVGNGTQKVIVDGKEMLLEGLMVAGQYFRSYDFSTNSITASIGANLHPTALYKLLNIDVSKIENTHAPLTQINNSFNNKLLPIFEDSKDTKELINNLNSFFTNASLYIDKNTEQIDLAISLIRENDGLLNVLDLVDEISISQKTLENHFKKIVGLTPGKYTRLYRFVKLMRKYESKEIDLNDLIHRYDYYDRSHFTKDFKLFMHQSPKTYFNTNNTFINEYLNK
ncbi:helix-turn-helix domain-containing protein [Psychroserpens jangbogonensis]|uniref:helix-turn-helix domain-containing protein n=1 Tax=Psychroserpens jangbogonensis TaxID=1484460 RepID=UPI00053D9932|nr:helix-turn-helix domain-containing protein [Psychroserpens jangbogonensis]